MLFELFVCTIYHANQKSGRYVLRYDNSVKKKFQHKKNQSSSFLTPGNATDYTHNSCGQLTRKSFSVARVKAVYSQWK